MTDPVGSTPALVAARRAGIPVAVHAYVPSSDAASHGLDAAEQLGFEPARVFKTLVVRLDAGELAVAVIPVDRSLDLKALAEVAGAKGAVMAEPSAVERATGYVLGGISPLGQRKRLRTWIDARAIGLERICVSAGRRGLQMEVDPRDLLRAVEGRTAPISR